MIKAGDKISWRQFQSATARGGIAVETSSGGETVWSLQDQNGSFINSGSITGQWDDRTADLSGLAGGAISLMGVGLDTATTGYATIQFADMAIFSTDGTVTPIFNGGSAAFTRGFGNNSMANAQASVGSYPATAAATHFFIGDHLGTAQMEFAAGGWPLWQGQFAPYGQEIDSQNTQNHYKFTGKERDAESGLDYFGARYYSNNMGRFMSPDWAAKAMTVPYAKLDNPQSLNLYSYVLNNPLNKTDPDGHVTCTGGNDQCAQIKTGLDLARGAQEKLGVNSKEGKAIGKVLAFYGEWGKDNGVHVSFGKLAGGALGQGSMGANGSINIKFDLNAINSATPKGDYIAGTSLAIRAGTVIHEGTHGVDERMMGHNPQNRHELLGTERNAWTNESYVYRGMGGIDTPDHLSEPGSIEQGAQASTDLACKEAGGCKP